MRTRIERLAHAGHPTERFWQEATDALRLAVPFDFHPCWFTLDPEHLVITGHFNPGMTETPHEIVRSQYAEIDVNAFSDLARRPVPAATVTAETGGDPAVSWRWQHLLAPRGFDDALDAVLRVRGTAWGAVSLLRAAGEAPFREADVRFVAQLSPALAAGTRLGLMLHPASSPAEDASPAVLLVSGDLSLTSATPGTERWLADLPDTSAHRPGRLPVPVQVAVVRAVTAPDGETTMRLRARSGTWVRIHAAALTGDQAGQVAVVVEPAQPGLVAPLVLRAHGLSDRERDVVDLVLRGLSTQQIASTLFVSPYTVQDRLKSVFEKVGVRSRRDLVARLRLEWAGQALRGQSSV